MRRKIEKYRGAEPGAASDYSIGCILLQSPFFFAREEWFPVPWWHPSIQCHKGHSTDDEVGKRLWAEVQLRLEASDLLVQDEERNDEGLRYGEPQTVLPHNESIYRP
jgi:putative restriction endonuclease